MTNRASKEGGRNEGRDYEERNELYWQHDVQVKVWIMRDCCFFYCIFLIRLLDDAIGVEVDRAIHLRRIGLFGGRCVWQGVQGERHSHE